LISAPYRLSGQIVGSVGVLGPTRMEYDRAITAVSYVSSLMSEILAEA
jgi:heat-inducible transcriptional repressor